MGLDYGITTYVKPERLTTCLKWLYNNSYYHNNETLQINYQGENLLIRGTSFKPDREVQIEQGITFSTCLVFDIDPHIIGSLAHWNWEDNPALLDDFKENFMHAYLGDGKIKIGHFDASIKLIEPENIYCLDFTAVTTGMSQMVRDSPAVKKWVLELSRQSDALLSCLDMESEGYRILYSRGQEIDITIKEGFQKDSQAVQDFVSWSFKGDTNTD